MRKSGLVKSVRGAHEGYLLVTSPDKISEGQILRTLEGEILHQPTALEMMTMMVECTSADACATANSMGKIRDSINQVIDSYISRDMVREHKSICKGTEYTNVKSTS